MLRHDEEVERTPKYMAVHTFPGPVTVEQATPLVRKLVQNEGRDAYWVEGWAQTNEEGKVLKVFCEWNAKDEKAIREIFAKVPEFPLDNVHRMAKIDSVDFRG